MSGGGSVDGLRTDYADTWDYGDTCICLDIKRNRRDGGAIRSCRATGLLATDPDVVLGVARGIVGIAAGIVCAEGRLSGGIDRLIGVAAGERERHKSENDRDPHFACLEFNDRRRRRPSRPAFSGRRRVRCCSARS
jgi:hypothetical protein